MARPRRPPAHPGVDLDGTVTARELLPLIAEELGLGREMRTLTELTISGTIDFEDSFRSRCAILSALPISRVQQIVAAASPTGRTRCADR